MAKNPVTPPNPAQDVRRLIFRSVHTNVTNGKMTEAEASAALKSAGFPDKDNPYRPSTGSLGKTLSPVAKAVGFRQPDQTAQGPVNVAKVHQGGTVSVFPGATSLVGSTLAGLEQTAVDNPGGSVRAVTHPRATAKEIGHNVKQTVLHPQDHPANAALLGWAALSGGAALGSRIGGATGAIRAGEGARAAVTRSGAEGGSLLHTPEPGTQTIWVPAGRPTAAPHVADAGTDKLVENLAAQKKLARANEAGTAPPDVAAQANKLVAERSALLAANQKARSTPMGTAVEGPVQAIPVERLLPRNVVARQYTKARGNRIQKKLNANPGDTSRLTRGVRGTVSAQSTVGRELRAQRRVENAYDLAKVHAQSKAVHGTVKGLSRGEHAALSVIAVEGPEILRNPAAAAEAIQRHTERHVHFANLGGDAAGANAERVTDLKLAAKALENPSKRLIKAAGLTRQVSQDTQDALIQAGHLTPETAQGRLDKMAQEYGHQAAPQGSFFHPMSSRYTDQPLGQPPGAYSPKPGPYGSGPVQPSQYVQGLHKQFTGESVAQGKTPVDIASTITDRAHRVQRLLSAERQYQQMWKIASPTRRSEFDVPIRDTREIRTELKQFFAKMADQIHASPDELASLDAAEVKRLTDMLQPDVRAGIGESVEGVKWVDRRYLADLGETNVRGLLEKAADAITNPIRTADIYATPGYILNLAGNLGMAGITQGVRAFPALKAAATAPEHDAILIDSLVGASKSRSYALPTTGPVSKANARLAEAWNAVTDLHARRSAFYHEAAKAGFNTHDEVHTLLTDPAHRSKMIEVARRANKNMVDYGSLTPIEKNTLRRLIFFYPWISRATLWSLRTLVEHPGKTFALSQLAQVGADHADQAFPGGIPKWADGLIPVGKSHGDLQNVINLSSVNTPSSAAQAIRTVGQTVGGLVRTAQNPSGDTLAEAGTPALEALLGAAGADTGATPGGALGKAGVAGKIVAGLPQVQALRRSGLAPGLTGPTSKTYPQTGLGPALGPYSGHGAYPRGISKSALHAQAKKEMSSEQRAAANVTDEQDKLVSEASRVLPGVKMPPQVAKAYQLQTRRKVAYARLPAHPTQQDRLEADMKLMQDLGLATPQQVAEARRAFKGATDQQIQQVRTRLNRDYFGGEIISHARKVVRDHGGVLSTTG